MVTKTTVLPTLKERGSCKPLQAGNGKRPYADGSLPTARLVGWRCRPKLHQTERRSDPRDPQPCIKHAADGGPPREYNSLQENSLAALLFGLALLIDHFMKAFASHRSGAYIRPDWIAEAIVVVAPLPLALIVEIVVARGERSIVAEPTGKVVSASKPAAAACLFAHLAAHGSSSPMPASLMASTVTATVAALGQCGCYRCDRSDCKRQSNQTRCSDFTKHGHGSFPLK